MTPRSRLSLLATVLLTLTSPVGAADPVISLELVTNVDTPV